MCRLEGPVGGVDRPGLRDRLAHRVRRASRHVAGGPAAAPGRRRREAPSTARSVPSGPGFEVENNLQLFLSLLYSARERIIITSPYFVPDDSMLRGLMAATARGVQVDLFVSEIGDQGLVWHAQRSYYGALLGAGVRIYCYPAPYILHAKHFSVDDEVALIGSSNMDMRSFGLNSEISLMVRSRDVRRGDAGCRGGLPGAQHGADPRRVGAGAAAPDHPRRARPAHLRPAVAGQCSRVLAMTMRTPNEAAPAISRTMRATAQPGAVRAQVADRGQQDDGEVDGVRRGRADVRAERPWPGRRRRWPGARP